jgi:hypothetical protein
MACFSCGSVAETCGSAWRPNAIAKRSAVPTVTHALEDVSIVQIICGEEMPGAWSANVEAWFVRTNNYTYLLMWPIDM